MNDHDKHGLISAAALAQQWNMSESRVRDIMRASGITRISGYPRDAALAAHRPGRGTRTDLLRQELAPLAARIVEDAPPPRAIRVDRHTLPDDVTVLVSWHRLEHFGGPYADTAEREHLDSVWAIAPSRIIDGDEEDPAQVWCAGDKRWVYGIDLRNPDTVLDALVRVVAAARRDQTTDNTRRRKPARPPHHDEETR